MATVEFRQDDIIEGLPVPSRSLVDAGPASLIRVRTRIIGLPIGQEMVLPYGKREAGRLRFAWLLTFAIYFGLAIAALSVLNLIWAIISFSSGFGGLLPLIVAVAAMTAVSSAVVVLTYVPQHPTLARPRVIRILAVNEDVALEWVELAGGRISIVPKAGKREVGTNGAVNR